MLKKIDLISLIRVQNSSIKDIALEFCLDIEFVRRVYKKQLFDYQSSLGSLPDYDELEDPVLIKRGAWTDFKKKINYLVQ
jgi:hypothetical protein